MAQKEFSLANKAIIMQSTHMIYDFVPLAFAISLTSSSFIASIHRSHTPQHSIHSQTNLHALTFPLFFVVLLHFISFFSQNCFSIFLTSHFLVQIICPPPLVSTVMKNNFASSSSIFFFEHIKMYTCIAMNRGTFCFAFVSIL